MSNRRATGASVSCGGFRSLAEGATVNYDAEPGPTMVEGGEPNRVPGMRRDFQRTMKCSLVLGIPGAVGLMGVTGRPLKPLA
jgi:hypothetical protein